MKLVTWNCARGFAKKAECLFSLCPDIAVIQECSRADCEKPVRNAYRTCWAGENPQIGMAVLYGEDWQVEPVACHESIPRWVVPYRVTGPENFSLIAVWACQIPRDRQASYVGQIRQALAHHSDWFTSGPVVMAGDFNSNARFNPGRPAWNHSTMVEELRQFGLVSYYHASQQEEHGKETVPTFYLTKNLDRPFHLDYIFAPEYWRPRASFELAPHSDWLAHSDHCPLTLTLRPA